MASTSPAPESAAAHMVDSAVASGGAYDIIRKRLDDQGQQLTNYLHELNQARLNEFGRSAMELKARVRVRTENNCVARDIVQVGEYLLFGYNVFIGLKKETKVEDVFALFRKTAQDGELDKVVLTDTFLAERSFVNDFDELYRYYKHARLVELTQRDGKLLAGFQIGERLEDVRVFRWSMSPDGQQVQYIDNRGERDIALPPAYDFDWVSTTRDNTVHGRHPHLNILDTVFVETIGGDLTVKIENNTDNGLGIYSEEVDDLTQSLDDASVFYAAVGNLILLKIRPYREQVWRHLVFNKLTQTVVRINNIGQSCLQLPENHGLIFPGGYYLSSGEYKIFAEESNASRFKRMIRSPNGEDVLYVFYDPVSGTSTLLAYNLIEKKLQNPMSGHGYALADNGEVVIFSAEAEPTRVHPMQIWETPYVSAEFASKMPVGQNFYGRIGNNDLVRGISDFYAIARLISQQAVSLRLYEELSQAAKKVFDNYYWLHEAETRDIAKTLREIAQTAELVIDEFEKVESIRLASAKAMANAEQEQISLLAAARPDNFTLAEEYVDALGRLRKQRGHLVSLKEYRYIDQGRLEELDQQLLVSSQALGDKTLEFLATEKSLVPYTTKIAEFNQQIAAATTKAALAPVLETIEKTAAGLDLLSELMATLSGADTTVRTRIVDTIGEVYAKLNQSRANARHQQKNFGSAEAVAQFGAQFKLFSQSIAHALGLATNPERCDEQLAKSLVRLEELEAQFSEYDQFLADIMAKREEIYESFQEHKQRLLDERQQKAQNLSDAATRILNNIEKRSLSFSNMEELNTYFAADALAIKIRELIKQLKEIDNAIKADDLDARLKAIRNQASRALRDKSDLFEEQGSVVKLGPRHKFSVNQQDLDLTILPKDGELFTHLTGTQYYGPINSEELLALKDVWSTTLESENTLVYRAEYLAWLIMEAAGQKQMGLSFDFLRESLVDELRLCKIVQDFAGPRYKEGYQKGIHDQDAVKILQQLLPALERADLLRYDPLCRAVAQIFWSNLQALNEEARLYLNGLGVATDSWKDRAISARDMHTTFASTEANRLLVIEVQRALEAFLSLHPVTDNAQVILQAAHYLVAELARDTTEFITSKYAVQLADELKASLDDAAWRHYQTVLKKTVGRPEQAWQITRAWLQALAGQKNSQHLQRYIPEAAVLINLEQTITRRLTQVDLELSIGSLMGEHPTIKERQLHFSVDDFVSRLTHHQHYAVVRYQRYLDLKHDITRRERDILRLEDFKAKPLSSFVRNRLISEAYLPIIGDNLAKQMGALGEHKRTDLMGLLMMISPPGYGKTTLMEYVANRLGLIFMKINCPSLGHDVLSLDPAQAPNATALQELVKLNLALEMGNNVMLYLDDIQHTHAEFLQKFISLCDGTRRIEGVWQGQTKTYDMRGRKFCVVMAGNPYTESGEAFKVPDMLANRADIYNLGDILGGMEQQFALSYIENCLTSNRILAPLALRDMNDLYKLVAAANSPDENQTVPATELSHGYSAAEINEILTVLRKLLVIQQVVLKINQQYIASAAQDDQYRVEPPFKLQGSYRNMNKMAEKVSAVMNQVELMQLINDHYLGEAQMLTSGAESNLLKLAELRGDMTVEQQQRWQQIKEDFLRNKALGGASDTGTRLVLQLADVNKSIQQLAVTAEAANQKNDPATFIKQLRRSLNALTQALAAQSPKIEIINPPPEQLGLLLQSLSHTLDVGVLPLIEKLHQAPETDSLVPHHLQEVANQLRRLEEQIRWFEK